jgi:hypothetical protein
MGISWWFSGFKLIVKDSHYRENNEMAGLFLQQKTGVGVAFPGWKGAQRELELLHYLSVEITTFTLTFSQSSKIKATYW